MMENTNNLTLHVESGENKRLRAKFDFEKYGFYAVTPYIDAQIGFGCKKKLNDQDMKNVSGIGFYISNETLNNNSSTRKAFYITATYGEDLAEGIRLRTKQNFCEPLDLEFRDEFFYETTTEKIYKKEKEINANSVLLEVYRKHIKTTRPIVGLLLRIRLRFWRIWLPWIPKSLSFLSHHFLWLISGERYTYEFLFQEETLNGKVISSKLDWRIDRAKEITNIKEIKEEDKEAKLIDFFGNKVPQWAIVFYSILHLGVWFFFKYFGVNIYKIEEFFGNNFLLVLYVIVSFWIVGTVIPFFLKKMVKYFSSLAFSFASKTVKV